MQYPKTACFYWKCLITFTPQKFIIRLFKGTNIRKHFGFSGKPNLNNFLMAKFFDTNTAKYLWSSYLCISYYSMRSTIL